MSHCPLKKKNRQFEKDRRDGQEDEEEEARSLLVYKRGIRKVPEAERRGAEGR